jgi:hypothetical protein
VCVCVCVCVCGLIRVGPSVNMDIQSCTSTPTSMIQSDGGGVSISGLCFYAGSVVVTALSPTIALSTQIAGASTVSFTALPGSSPVFDLSQGFILVPTDSVLLFSAPTGTFISSSGVPSIEGQMVLIGGRNLVWTSGTVNLNNPASALNVSCTLLAGVGVSGLGNLNLMPGSSVLGPSSLLLNPGFVYGPDVGTSITMDVSAGSIELPELQWVRKLGLS